MAAIDAAPGAHDGVFGRLWARVQVLRERLLADPRVLRRLAAFPLTRPAARRHARALFDLCAGFVYSQILDACVRLRLFDVLAQAPRTPAELAGELGVERDAAEMLLESAAALGLVEHRAGGRYGLGVLGAALRANPGVTAMIEHHRLLYPDLADPVALLRREQPATALSKFWGYVGPGDPAALPAGHVASYSALMSASQQLVADEVLDAYSLRGHRTLLDVGGGEGTFLVAAAARHAALKLVLFDLPAVAERARQRFAQAGLADRATALGGDFHVDPLPAGADVVSLVRVCFDHPDERVLALLRRVHAALPPGGTLLVAEPMADAPGAERVGAAYFGWYLWAMGKGRPRSAAALGALLRAAGFRAVVEKRTRTPLQAGLVVARKAI